MTDPTCTCDALFTSLSKAVRAEVPTCPVHVATDDETPAETPAPVTSATPVALNDDATLKAIALGGI